MSVLMNLVRRAGWLACLSSALLMSACGGGGGGGGSNEGPSARPAAANTITIESSTSGIARNTYGLDIQYRGASGSTMIGDEEAEFVSPESSEFDISFIYAKAQPAKFVVIFTTEEEELFACLSAAWSDAESTEIHQVLAELLAGSTIPACSKNINVDSAAHRIDVQSLKLSSLTNSLASITFSTDFSWTHQPDSVLANSLSVLAGSTGMPAAKHPITGFMSTNGQRVNDDLTVGMSTVNTEALRIELMYPLQNMPDRYALVVRVSKGATYACASAGLTTQEQQAFAAYLSLPGMPRCPSSANYNFSRSLLTLDEARFQNLSGTESIGIDVSTSLDWAPPPTPATSTSPSPSPSTIGLEITATSDL